MTNDAINDALLDVLREAGLAFVERRDAATFVEVLAAAVVGVRNLAAEHPYHASMVDLHVYATEVLENDLALWRDVRGQ